MFAKLAGRNVRRQLGNYLIYFITVSLTVALMFAMNNVTYSDQLADKAETMGNVSQGILGVTIAGAVITAFVLGYATSFMLKLRKREFGTYLTLGMTRRNLLSIFLTETMIMCLIALGTGIALGMFIYQGMMFLIMRLMEVEIEMADYSPEGLLLTVVLVCAMFILASAASALYLKRVKIYDLIHGDRVVDKQVKHPAAWLAAGIVSLGGMVASFVIFKEAVDSVMTGSTSGMGIFGSMALMSVSIVMMHIAAARSVTAFMLKNRRFCSRGTNTFTLRQLSGKMRANSVMAGLLSFLIAFAVIGVDVSFTQKVSEEMSIDTYYPFDVTLMEDVYNTEESGEEEGSPITPEEGKRIIERYSPVKEEIPYTIYDTGEGYLHSFTPWTGEGYEGLTDTVIKESEYNRLREAKGYDPVDLEGGFLIGSEDASIRNSDFSGALLELGGKTYEYRGMADNWFDIFWIYFVAVVPDEAAEGLEVAGNCISYDLVKDRYDAEALEEELFYEVTVREGDMEYSQTVNDYRIREAARISRNSFSAIFVVAAIYIGIVFVFMAMAMLALKTLSGISDDRRRYRVLFQLGAGEREQRKTLFRQIFSFFFLPFAVPLLSSIPAAWLCAYMIKQAGLAEGTGFIYVISAIVVAVMIIIYALYFLATYMIARRNVVYSEG